MRRTHGTQLTLAGALLAALAASACCLGPLLVVGLGLGSVGFALALEPYRPWFLAGAALLLALGFYLTYRSKPVPCPSGDGCESPRAGGRAKVFLWLVVGLVVLAASFPFYSRFLF
jgi:mercuric ion transport protein